MAAASGVAAGRPEGWEGPRPKTSGWWQAWWARFGLAEVCGTAGAVAGFAAGYLPARSVLAAAALATVCEVIAFYGCVGTKTALAARRATAHLAGWRRLAAGAWHAVKEQLASCAVAEALDDFLIRPACLAGAALLLRPLPGGVWLGFVAGKAAADAAWYGMEASVRWGVTRSAVGRQPAARYRLGGTPLPVERGGAAGRPAPAFLDPLRDQAEVGPRLDAELSGLQVPRLIRAAFVGADGQAGALGQQVGPAPGHLAERSGGFLLLGLGQLLAAGEAARHATDLG
jgi:hypothetical protein